jgi:hypothetical protein
LKPLKSKVEPTTNIPLYLFKIHYACVELITAKGSSLDLGHGSVKEKIGFIHSAGWVGGDLLCGVRI